MKMQNDNIKNYKESREKLICGVQKVADIIKPTYGSAGQNIVIEEQLRPLYRIANDGKLIADAIVLSDPIENMGANIIREACDKQEKDAGDGRKTTCILTSAILNEGLLNEYQGWFSRFGNYTNPLDIKRSLDECLPIILKAIDDHKKEITVDEVHTVATISSENKEIGKVIGEIYQKIGREGIIEIEPSNLPKTFYEVVDGVRLRFAGSFGPYSYTETGKAVYKNPKILISREKITSVDQIEPIFVALSKEGINELVIYCEDIDMSVASRLALTHLQGGFKTLVIKSPTMWKDWLYEDFALLTGATIVDNKAGKTFKTLELKDLGTCDKIITTADETRVIGTKDISQHIKKLEELSLEDDQLRVRASWLNTKVGVLKIGANSESELSYIIKKAKDACNASYYALKGGIVTGGGICLQDISNVLPNTTGGNILSYALKAPYTQICQNLGVSEFSPDESIVDPALVVKSAITTAISIAGSILTCGGAITIPRIPDTQQPNQPILR